MHHDPSVQAASTSSRKQSSNVFQRMQDLGMHDSCDFQIFQHFMFVLKTSFSDPSNTGVASSETVLAYWDSLGISNGSQVISCMKCPVSTTLSIDWIMMVFWNQKMQRGPESRLYPFKQTPTQSQPKNTTA